MSSVSHNVRGSCILITMVMCRWRIFFGEILYCVIFMNLLMMHILLRWGMAGFGLFDLLSNWYLLFLFW